MPVRDIIANGIRKSHSEWSKDVAKDPPFAPEDGGVPREMWNGEVDPEGWVEWKMIESTITENDFSELEREFGHPIPAGVREYFLVPFFHVVDQVNNGETLFFLPGMPADNPFGHFSRLVLGWRPLLEFGYFPFAEYQDGWGPICLKESDGTIVWFDHEEVVVDPSTLTASFLAEREKPLSQSLMSFWTTVFPSNDQHNKMLDTNT